MEQRLGFGIASRPRAGMERLGIELERLGYDELWANDTPAGSGPATLAVAAPGTQRLDLAVGVAGLTRRRPDEIAAEVAALDLPLERLILGVGSGSSASLDLVRRGIADLRQLLPDVRLAVAALGPRMCCLAGQIADVVLLNWAGPARIAWARDEVTRAAAAAGRPAPRMAGYVRCAIGPGAGERLANEARSYQRAPGYARSFAEQGDPTRLGIAVEAPRDLAEALRPYREALDSCVVRALPATDATDDWLAVAMTAAATDRR